MLGSMFTGTDEAQVKLKSSKGAKVQDIPWYGVQCSYEEGFKRPLLPKVLSMKQTNSFQKESEGRVAYKGAAADIVFQMIGGIRSGMGYCEC